MNRKSFLQNLSLLTGSAFISLQSNAFTKLKRNETIHGSVTDAGKGVKNVVISDGYTVVVTDNKGNYSITPHEKANNLF